MVLCAVELRAQNPLSTDVKAGYELVKNNILRGAEKMPAADYGFKPTPEVRTFGQLIIHIADAQTGMCGIAKGEMKRGDAASRIGEADLLQPLKRPSSSVMRL
jgi:hypothetical protein